MGWCAKTRMYGGKTTFNSAMRGHGSQCARRIDGNPEQSASRRVGTLRRRPTMQYQGKRGNIGSWDLGHDPDSPKEGSIRKVEEAPSATSLGDSSRLRQSYLCRGGRVTSIGPREWKGGRESKIIGQRRTTSLEDRVLKFAIGSRAAGVVPKASYVEFGGVALK
ncbi:hypothetical protein R3P38DRAFT_2788137 [Favolaschia claudopus]|uniref:Uncharacterized protein n=1 Tax=Favolaschia claudopus TaxID=2862362 RepID=A0AAW0ALU5_9AGAR